MSLTATRLLDLITSYEGKLDSAENRLTKFGLLEGFRADTAHPEAIVDMDIKRQFAESNFRSAFKVPVMNRFTPSLGSARSCTISDPETTSALQTVTTTIYTWGFRVVPAENEGNYVSVQKEWQHKYRLGMEAIGKAVETACAAALSTNKSQKEESPYTGSGAKYGDFETADEISVAASLRSDFFNDAESIMNYNDFYQDGLGNFNVFASTSLRSVVNQLSAQGPSNATNTAYQFPGFDFIYSNRIAPGASNFAAGYIVPKGQVGILERTAWEHRQVGDVQAGTKTFSSMVDPITGFTMGTLFYTDCIDQSGRFSQTLAYNTAAYTEHYGFNLEVAIFTPYNSSPTTLAGPIMKFVMTNA